RGQPARRLLPLGHGALPLPRDGVPRGEEGEPVSIASSRRKAATIAILLAIALFAGINWLGARHWWRGDWTSAGVYSISEVTRKTVAGLTPPVRITVFMTRQSRLYQPVTELLNRYRRLSDKLEIEFLDPERNPA